MIGLKFRGRLGNQLFQLHYFEYLKSNNPGTKFFFVNPQDSQIAKYFNVGIHNWYLGSKLFSLFTRYIPIIGKYKNIYIQNAHRPKEPILQDRTVIHGFFQSDWYINNSKKTLKIEIKHRYKKEFDDLYGSIFKNSLTIAVHIRRTDYLNYNKRDISLPIEYFKKQLNKIKNLNTYKVFFVSDDVPFVESHFPRQANFIFSTNTEIIDFQIIQNADIAIISNSTFAWWAAYLNKKAKVVIGPKNWIGFRLGKEHPKGIMTERFDWTDVFE